MAGSLSTPPALRKYGPQELRRNANRLLVVCHILLALCLVTSAILVLFDSSVRIETIWKISAVSFLDPSERPPPPAKGARLENVCLPASSVDAHWWILHTERMLREGAWRIRYTGLDNAPQGREVHWSSLLIWLLAAGATVVSFINGLPPAENVAETALFIGPVAMSASLALLGFLAWRALGRTGALVFGCAFLTSPYIYRTFHAGEADHHGLVLVFCMAGLIAILGGLQRNAEAPSSEKKAQRKTSRRDRFRPAWFRLAGVFGGAGLWVSAATAIPILGACGIGAVAAAAFSRKFNVRTLPPRAWQSWGMAGGVASFIFYLIEYFPAHLGCRLEVNHPFHSLAWVSGSFLVSRACHKITGGRFFQKPVNQAWAVGFAIFFTLLPAALIALFPQNVFWVRDTFLLALHKEYISEFQSIFQMLSGVKGPPLWLFDYGWAFFAIAGAIFLAFRRTSALSGILWTFAPAIVMQALAFHQVRWGTAAAGMWVVTSLGVISAGTKIGGRVSSGLIVTATVCAWIMALLALAPRIVSSVVRHEECLRPPLKEEVGNGLLLRDIAHRLVRSGVSAPPVVLTGPNSSTLLSYFAGIRTLGTLYWENNPGLHRAARIFASKDEAEARQRILEAGVTHILLPSWENFGNAYARLYSLVDPAVDPEAGASFFKAIAEDKLTPRWLRPFSYPIPTESGIDGTSVRIFAVLPEQNEFEFHYFQGLYFFQVGKHESAARHLRQALVIRPGHNAASSCLREVELRGGKNPAGLTGTEEGTPEP